MFLLCSNIYVRSLHLFSTRQVEQVNPIKLLLHTSLKMNFPVIDIVATQQSTWYSELMVDIIFLLVRICFLTQGVKSNPKYLCVTIGFD